MKKSTKAIREKAKLRNLITKLNKGTFIIKKRGSKYHVRDVVEFDGNYGLMSGKELMKEFG